MGLLDGRDGSAFIPSTTYTRPRQVADSGSITDGSCSHSADNAVGHGFRLVPNRDLASDTVLDRDLSDAAVRLVSPIETYLPAFQDHCERA
jgi:hypothetical protein